MKLDLNTFKGINTPIYIIEERRLRKNLQLISDVARAADVEIILAFKAFALWKTFPIFREYIKSTTASSMNEALLAYREFGSKAHTYSPAYVEEELEEIVHCSSHLTFNSLSQYNRLHEQVKQYASSSGNSESISLGLRVNPEYSEVGTDLYNPCAPGTRFGVTADKLPEKLPSDIEGFHCHCHCESGADVLERTLVHIEEKFARWFPQIKWLNLGGGHLMTRADYDVDLLIRLMNGLHERYPWLHIILEPGSAFAWQTGPLVSQVVDVVEDKGIRTAILNVSFTCHTRLSAGERRETVLEGSYLYRLGGNSCLSGDFMGMWRFDHELQIGETVVFEDMIHYTTVKTNMFNGITHPSIGIAHLDGSLEVLRTFGYEDYKNRMN